jgi:predicted RNA polymerase sigma factor
MVRTMSTITITTKDGTEIGRSTEARTAFNRAIALANTAP